MQESLCRWERRVGESCMVGFTRSLLHKVELFLPLFFIKYTLLCLLSLLDLGIVYLVDFLMSYKTLKLCSLLSILSVSSDLKLL
jgi:hypothetical protein